MPGGDDKKLRVPTAERLAVAELPELHDRIHAMGLSQEYSAYRDRYQGWRRGEHHGAEGELNTTELLEKKRGFGYWYPSLEVWTWRRTLSFWIAVTFFEGSIFFIISSFAFCYPGLLGKYKQVFTTFGYIAGKVNFIICTYFMCLSSINLVVSDNSYQHPIDISSDIVRGGDTEPFYFWPFHYRTATSKLKSVGIGPWPYFAAVIYFIGVLIYCVGLIAEFSPLSQGVIRWTLLISFVLGSLSFVLGGVMECIENEVFTTLKCDIGWMSAFLNTLGGLLFLAGSVLGFFNGQDYAASFMFAMGAVVFACGSAGMIVMWKDEQFGLAYFSALNQLGGPSGKPMVFRGWTEKVEEEATFSIRSAIFVMIYCISAAVSVYDFMISMQDITLRRTSIMYVLAGSFNALLPCIFAHFLLALNSAVVRPPRLAPYRQLYFGCRILALLMVASSTQRMIETILNAANGEYVHCQLGYDKDL